MPHQGPPQIGRHPTEKKYFKVENIQILLYLEFAGCVSWTDSPDAGHYDCICWLCWWGICEQTNITPNSIIIRSINSPDRRYWPQGSPGVFFKNHCRSGFSYRSVRARQSGRERFDELLKSLYLLNLVFMLTLCWVLIKTMVSKVLLLPTQYGGKLSSLV